MEQSHPDLALSGKMQCESRPEPAMSALFQARVALRRRQELQADIAEEVYIAPSCLFSCLFRLLLTSSSKLEELAAEVQTIKDAVAPRSILSAAPELSPVRDPVQLPRPQLSPHPLADTFLPTPPNLFSRPRPYSLQSETPAPPPIKMPDVSSLTASLPPHAAEPRALGSRVFSGEEINYYFDK